MFGFDINKKTAKLMLSGLFVGWGTRTRTRKGRTRICSVTITPYPKLYPLEGANLSFAGAKVQHFIEPPKFFRTFLSLTSKKDDKRVRISVKKY